MQTRVQGEYTIYSDRTDKLHSSLEGQLEQCSEDLVYWDTKFADSVTFLRPGWSPVRLQQQFYLGTAFALKTKLTDGATDLDDLQKVIDKLASQNLTVRRIAEVLNTSSRKSTKTVEQLHTGKLFATRSESISFIIPTAFAKSSSGIPLIEECLKALKPLLQKDEVIVVTTKDFEPALVEELAAIIETASEASFIHVIDEVEQFNYSRRINLGFAASSKNLLVTLNDDVEIQSAKVLNQLTGYALNPQVGLVGAKLLYPNGMVQHAGHRHGDIPKIAYQRTKAKSDYFLDKMVDREVSGVTGALTMQRSDIFAELGGYCEEFPIGYNDVDFCLKLTAAGYSIIQVNSAVAIHHESATRKKTTSTTAGAILKKRWGNYAAEEYFTRNPYA